jgi:hypothetical protein
MITCIQLFVLPHMATLLLLSVASTCNSDRSCIVHPSTIHRASTCSESTLCWAFDVAYRTRYMYANLTKAHRAIHSSPNVTKRPRVFSLRSCRPKHLDHPLLTDPDYHHRDTPKTQTNVTIHDFPCFPRSSYTCFCPVSPNSHHR